MIRQLQRLRAAALVCLVVLTACNVKVRATATLNADGSGKLAATIELDPKAVELAKRTSGSLTAAIALQDLKGAGWSVGEWIENEQGAKIEIERETVSPSDLEAAIEEIGGGRDGVLREVEVKIESGLYSSDHQFAYEVDLSKLRLDDPEIVVKLQEAGVTPAAMADLAANRATKGFTLELTSDLPMSEPTTKRFQWGDKATVSETSAKYHPVSAGLVTMGALSMLVGAAGAFGNANKRRRARRRQAARAARQ